MVSEEPRRTAWNTVTLRPPPKPPPPQKIYRQEFEALAGISKTRFFDLLADPQIAAQLDVGIDDNGRYANRRKALAFIEGHRARREAARLKVRENLGAFATRTPGPRGRPCPPSRQPQDPRRRNTRSWQAQH